MSAPVARVVVDNTMGAAFLGVVIAGVLYGVTCVQTWYYYTKYPKDAWYIKFLVAFAWLFDTIHQALITHTVYWYVITNFANAQELGNMVWSVLLEVLFNGLTASLVQGFLTWRLWLLSGRNIYYAAISAALTLAGLACSIAFTIQSLQLVTWVDLGQLKGLSMTVNVLGVATDMPLAIALCYFLRSSKTGFKKSNTIIAKLTIFAVSTGALTSLCAIASLVSILAWGQTLIYVAFYFSLGRLYVNSLLVTLNARKSIRAVAGNHEDIPFALRNTTSSRNGTKHITSSPGQNISVRIDTSTHYLHDRGTEKTLDDRDDIDRKV